MTRVTSLLLMTVFTCGFGVAGCGSKHSDTPKQSERIETQSAAINTWFEDRYQDGLVRSPMTQTYFGNKTGYNRLDDSSQLAQDETAALSEAWLSDMHANFDFNSLDPQAQLSYRLYEYSIQDELAAHAMSGNKYVFQHRGGPHARLPSFMINYHTVDSIEDAQAYIARLNAFPGYFSELSARTDTQFQNGVSLPKFVYEKLISASTNIISGAPFTQGKDSPLFKDIKAKVNALDISDADKSALINEARQALLNSVKPAYANLIAMFKIHESNANEDDGVWKFPDGAAYYQSRLKHFTTTDMTADEIHELGLKDVARIQDEMREIMTQVDFSGTLQEFYAFLRTDPQFQYPNTDAGRDAYITDATGYIDEIKGQLDDVFITKPKADMIVKRVEAYRENNAIGAFYTQPAIDGSRPGTYYINLKDMADQPTYLMQALAYHEGIPGHHMQIAIGMELEDLPRFRTLGSYTSYIEGWALYSESLAKELGLYTDPYKDFGRLSMEIFRSARLVVDTGIHAKKWTREQAVQYMMDNIPNPEGDIRGEVDRYIVWPGQATAYKIGMIKIEALRRDAKTRLGDKFDLREFHDIILANGAVPLNILEELVDDWVTTKT